MVEEWIRSIYAGSSTEKKISCPHNNFLKKSKKYQFVHKPELKYYLETFVQPQQNQLNILVSLLINT